MFSENVLKVDKRCFQQIRQSRTVIFDIKQFNYFQTSGQKTANNL